MANDRRAVEDETFGTDTRSGDSVDAKVRRRIQDRMQARSVFYIGLLVFLAINAMLWGIWLYAGGGFPWPVFITFTWGIGVMAQALQVYQTYPEGATRREAEIEREVDAEKRRMNISDESRRN